MEKYFNVTGSCNPSKHYMADISAKFDQVMRMVERGDYFAINRPRQYGKTTMLALIANSIRGRKGDYVLSRMSFEGVGDSMFEDETAFSPRFVDMFAYSLERFYPEESARIQKLGEGVSNLQSLSTFISRLTPASSPRFVILIDEVDKSSDNQLFLSFLGMLRDKYIAANDGEDTTFHSIILAGVHDVKSLKMRIRRGDERKLNSPWNIAADFNVDMSFNPAEIAAMLDDYSTDRGVAMDVPPLSERIHYYTSGYPFLVSKICKNIDEEAAANNPDYDPKRWTLDDVDWSFRWLTREDYTTTNFDDLVKNLENNQKLYDLVYVVLFGAEEQSVTFSALDPIVNQGCLYGILSERHGKVAIHNRIYEQILSAYMRSRKLTRDGGYPITGVLDHFERGGKLDVEKILLKFQEFMKEHYSDQDAAFLEREGRLVFMSFLKPIINGKGFMWKEPVVGPERRMDIVVTFGKTQKEVVELKIWRGEEYHQKGLQQLSDYLDFQNLKTGFLLIFDFNKSKRYKSKQIKFADKNLFAVWV